jgi:DNA-binding response OmpR family regulator
MSKAKILLVEDDPNLGEVLSEYLMLKGFEVSLKADGLSGLAEFQQTPYDICIFDVMMPKMDGFSLAENIRAQNQTVPIVFLTAKSMKEDTIKGFKVGADDYICKPFTMEELLLRLQVIIRRTNLPNPSSTQAQFKIGKFIFEYERQILYFDEIEKQKLTSKETDLLRELCLHKNQVLDRSKALKKIWGEDNYYNSRSMDVYINKLRKFLKADPKVEIINVHGQGFKLVEIK